MKKNFFKNKRVLVTGATGSIGSIIVKKLLNLNCKVIRALSNDENGLYELNNMLDKKNGFKNNFIKKMKKAKIRLLHGDVREYSRCLSASKNIDIVIHAAAMKHLSICEYNPKEALKTNTLGTQNMIKSALKNKVKRFLFISTDKVVSPTSILGKTKFAAENHVINENIKTKNTIFSAVRFGNIIGSRGSVVPKFLGQIKNNEPITITDKDMTRYVMTINTAVKLTLKVVEIMRGGEIFILKSMGKFRIYDLANSLKKHFKYKKKIKIVGKVQSEKLHERLFTTSESNRIQIIKNIYVINSLSQKKLANKYQRPLLEKMKLLTPEEIIKLLKKESII